MGVEQIIIDAFQNGITLKNFLISLFFLLLGGFLIFFKSWINSSIHYLKFKLNPLVSVGTKITVYINHRNRITGKIIHVDTVRIGIQDKENQIIVFVSIKEFVTSLPPKGGSLWIPQVPA